MPAHTDTRPDVDSPDVLTRDLIRHLSMGWMGFAGILITATNRGVRFERGEIDRLEKMTAEIADVVRRQRDRQREG